MSPSDNKLAASRALGCADLAESTAANASCTRNQPCLPRLAGNAKQAGPLALCEKGQFLPAHCRNPVSHLKHVKSFKCLSSPPEPKCEITNLFRKQIA